jgi:hypothetical protein
LLFLLPPKRERVFSEKKGKQEMKGSEKIGFSAFAWKKFT